jgi:serine/threonine-protein kinase
MDTTVADPLLGALLDGRYRIRGRIARGGMATVYHAVDERLERVVAVKVIKQTHAGNAEFLAKFDREAKTIARLTHPNVVAVYDTGDHQGLPYLVMEYVRGQTLRDVLARRGRLPLAEAVTVAESLLSAVAAAHRAGLVHRDVKPENVLIGEDNSVKVADFGLAQAVEASTEDPDGQLMATVAYVAPELVTDGRADPRSDVYSAGIVLFEMLTGRVPYVGERSVDVAYQHVEQDVPRPSTYLPSLPRQLDDLVVRATRRDPNARPSDAGALLAELKRVSEDLDLSADAMPTRPLRTVGHATVVMPQAPVDEYVPPPRHGSPERRRAGLVIAAAVVALGLLAAIGGWWLGAGRYTVAPSLLRMSKQHAESVARQQGFDIKYAAGRYDEKIRKDIVLDQDPGPRERIVKGGTITLVVSLGPERYTVPSLVGERLEKASEELRKLHLRPKIQEQYSDSVDRGLVMSVSPKAGTVVRRNTEVTLVVSKGQAPVTVPDVTGDHVDDATTKLEDAGLVVKVETKASKDVEADHVISQDPKPGTGVEDGHTVTLVVSTGAPQVEVPDVVDKPAGEAIQILEEAGFKVNVYGTHDGTVHEQNPSGGETADEGSTVSILCY